MRGHCRGMTTQATTSTEHLDQDKNQIEAQLRRRGPTLAGPVQLRSGAEPNRSGFHKRTERLELVPARPHNRGGTMAP